MAELTVTLVGGELHARIPSPSGGEQLIHVPCTLDGVRILKRILSAPAHYAHGTKLGTEREPTQSLVNEWLKAERQRQREAEASLFADLDLEIDL